MKRKIWLPESHVCDYMEKNTHAWTPFFMLDKCDVVREHELENGMRVDFLVNGVFRSQKTACEIVEVKITADSDAIMQCLLYQHYIKCETDADMISLHLFAKFFDSGVLEACSEVGIMTIMESNKIDFEYVGPL